MTSKAASAQYDRLCTVCWAEPGQPCRTRTTGRVTDTHLDRIPRFGDHTCRTLTPGCYRCELNRDELGDNA